MMQRNVRVTALTVATLFAAGCARSDFALPGRHRSFWNKAGHQKAGRAVQAPPPKILPETYFAAARLHETQRQFSQAMIQYRKAIAVNHRYVEAYHRLGMLLGATGQFAEANKALHRAVELSPDDAILRNNLGFQLLMEEDWHGARRELGRAIELRPGFARAHINLGLVLSKLGHFDEALEQFQAVLPEADAYYNMGLMYVTQKRYEEAAGAYRATLELNSEFHAARTQLEQLAAHLEPVTPAEPTDRAPDLLTQIAPNVIDPAPNERVAKTATEPEPSTSNPPAPAERSTEEWTEESSISTPAMVSNEEVGASFSDTATTESADENVSAPCEPTSQVADEGLDESPFFEVDVADDASPTPFEQPVRSASVANVQDRKTSDIATNDSAMDDAPAEAVRLAHVDTPVVEASGTPGQTSPAAMDVYDVFSPLEEVVEVGPPAPGELRVCTAVDRNMPQQSEPDEPNYSEDVLWSGVFFDDTEPPCDDRIAGELWADQEVDPTGHRRVADAVVAPSWNDIVDVRPTVPLAEESVEPGRNVTVKPVAERSEPAKVVAVEPVEVIAPPQAKVVRVATIAPPEGPIECFIDERPLPVSWNDVVPEDNYCVDRGALLRELDAHLEVVRAEIKCLDETLIDEVYRLAVLDRTKPDPPSSDVSVIEPRETLVAFPEPDMVPTESTELVGPPEPQQEPILVREEWEESIAEPIKKEPAARLMPLPAKPGPSFDRDAGVFDELVDLCSIVENETRCLAQLQSDDGAILSLAFDPTVESVLPPYVSFDLLLDSFWNTPVTDGEDLVCAADPTWCADENLSISKSNSDRRSSMARRTYSAWR